MKIKLGRRRDRMDDKMKSLRTGHRWFSWYPVIVGVDEPNSDGYVTRVRKELHWLTNVERCYSDHTCVWSFPKLWIFTYNYRAFNNGNPPEDFIPDQFGKYKRVEINKILKNHRYEEKLRKKIPAVQNAYDHYQTIAGLSFDDKLHKE